ncbi:putative peptide synthetase MbtF [Streptomyces inusitatus]|uniref:Peptide synthetase MbtF n=1 Tax=Streptomyces inusitatus TaxID=68221 RepID=A0A918QA41_9ACTN|nr:non-ribosomal peptide synthetase [Streptomyces inusitatus]GGZ38815.1 putative peptide synthetase MbtF [Streptomyces inusitatus]
MAPRGKQDIAHVLALGPLQRGLYSLNRMLHGTPERPPGDAGEPETDGAADIYSIAVLTDFHGPLDTERLRRALTAVLARHPHLLARFWDEGLPHPVQLVPAEVDFPWREVEMTAPEFQSYVRTAQYEPFDLVEGPPLRATLAALAPGHHRLLVVFHHIVLDGWSVPLFWRELADRYEEDGGEPVEASPAYPEYIGWLQRQDRQGSLRRWREMLAGVDEPTVVAGTAPPGVAPLPRLTMRSMEGPELDTLLARVRSLNLTVNTVAQVAWAVLLHRLTGREDTTFGVTVSGRPEEVRGIESSIGLFINTVPARVTLRPGETLRELCRRVQRDAAEQRAHGYVGLSEIQREAGAGDLFDTMMIFHNTPKGTARDTLDLGGGVTMSPVLMDSYTHYPLTVVPFLLDDRLYVNVDHVDALLGGLDAGRLAERFLHLVREIARDPGRTHRELDALLPGEAAELRALAEGPGVGRPADPADHGVHRAFERAADRHPGRTAVIDAEGELDYGTLDRWANSVAHRLRALGVGPETRVAVALPRTRAFFVALLGVLKAGGVLVPLDLSAPRERNAAIVELAGAQVLVAEPGEQEWWSGERCATGHEAPAAGGPDTGRLTGTTAADQAVHTVFTSGSTGEPKGVIATHRGLLTLLEAHREEIYAPVLEDPERVLRVGHGWSFAFDASWQPQLALLSGHTVVLFDEEDQRDPYRLVRGIREHRVDMLDTSPSMLGRLAEAGLIEGEDCPLSILALGGEDIPRSAWDVLAGLKGTRVHNFYGPTEITVEAVNALVVAGEEPQIGGAAPGSSAQVLGPDLRPVPVGVRGELYLGGLQVARGYQARPGLTAERFVPDPVTGERLYRTGDVVRRNADGRLVFLGRADDQVKVRGYRIELAEIVAALETRPDVARAVVVAQPEARGRVLVAYVVAAEEVRSAGGRLDPVELREDLARRIPHYMVPARWVELDSVPLTVNGKADLRALPRPTGGGDSPEASRPPATDAERTVLAAARALLDEPHLGVDDDMFHRGMDSIATISLVGELRRAGLQCTPRQIAVHRTPAEVARAVTAAAASAAAPGETGSEPVRTPALDWMRRLGSYRRFAQSQLIALPPGITAEETARALERVRAAHPQLSARTVLDADGRLALVPAEPDAVPRVLVAEEHPRLTPPVVLESAHRVWERLDPETGAMMTGVFLRETGTGVARLFLAVHHAVVDIVSLRVLLEDLAAAHGSPDPLLAEGTTMAEWSRALAARAGGSESRDQLPHWAGVAREFERAPRIARRSADPAVHTRGRLVSHRVTADAATTGALLRSARTTPENALLTAVALAEAGWRERHGHPADSGLTVVREGHGRRDDLVGPFLDRPVDTSRTVGWFNVFHPVVLDSGTGARNRLTPRGAAEDHRAALGLLEKVAEELTAVPCGGFDHGLLGESAEVPAEVLFSYLGRLDQVVTAAEDRPWTLVVDDALRAVFPEDSEPDAAQPYPLELVCAIHPGPDGPVVEALWRYDPGVCDEQDIKELAALWRGALDALAAAVAENERNGA